MREHEHQRKVKKRKTILRATVVILVFIFFLFGTGVGYYAASIGEFFNQISEGETGKGEEEIARQNLALSELEPFSVLLLGVDLDTQGQQRTDTVILATVNPGEESVKMVSIPRDVPITLDDGFTEKINAMHQIGGQELVSDVVGDMFNIPVSFYALMDFQGLIELVDAVGGITVNSDLEFTVQDSEENSEAIEIEEGVQELNGEEALGYARMRMQDPRGDFGRQERQQEVIGAIVDELLSLNTVSNFTRILNSTAPYLRTDATSEQLLVIAANYLESARNIDTLALDGEAGEMYFPHYGFSVYVFEPYEESIDEVSAELQEHLEIEPIELPSEVEEIPEEEAPAEEEFPYEEPAPQEPDPIPEEEIPEEPFPEDQVPQEPAPAEEPAVPQEEPFPEEQTPQETVPQEPAAVQEGNQNILY